MRRRARLLQFSIGNGIWGVERRFLRFGIVWLVIVCLFGDVQHFGDVLSLTMWVVIGVQHHKLAEILLCIFNPGIPKVGASRSIAVRSMEVRICYALSLVDVLFVEKILKFNQEAIKLNLRSLCGIGLYNRWTPPGMFTASMGIAICELLITLCGT